MCDQNDLDRFGALNRRRFAAAGGSAVLLAACNAGGGASATGSATSAANEAGLVARQVSIPTASGTISGWFYHPGEGRHPAVIMWPDIVGIRAASKAMGERLADEGYAVIVPDPYWRDEGHATFADFADFMESDGFATVTPYRDKLTPDAVSGDAKAIVAWLDAQDAVDTARGIGANGHCMTGSWTVYAANAVPERVTVAASMHGGGLVTDSPQSPHRMLVPTASYLIAIGQNDDAKEPDAKTELRAAADAIGANAEIEVYSADHGWTVPDLPFYDQGQAERAWGRMLAFLQAL